MEDTLGEVFNQLVSFLKDVLILVLMEDTLGEKVLIKKSQDFTSLNPCFNGRYSRSYDNN